jgi:hypothetical protein
MENNELKDRRYFAIQAQQNGTTLEIAPERLLRLVNYAIEAHQALHQINDVTFDSLAEGDRTPREALRRVQNIAVVALDPPAVEQSEIDDLDWAGEPAIENNGKEIVVDITQPAISSKLIQQLERTTQALSEQLEQRQDELIRLTNAVEIAHPNVSEIRELVSDTRYLLAAHQQQTAQLHQSQSYLRDDYERTLNQGNQQRVSPAQALYFMLRKAGFGTNPAPAQEQKLEQGPDKKLGITR